MKLETVQSVVAAGCAVLSCLSGLCLSTFSPPVFAAAPGIGTAIATGSFRVDDATVSGNATLFEGALVETRQSSSSLDLASGPRLLLGADSRGRVFGDRLVLERGSGEMSNAAGFRIEARGLTVRTETGHASARIRLSGNTVVEVASLSGGLRVLNSQGVLVANLRPGAALAFAPQAAGGAGGAPAANGEPERLTGCLRLASSHYLVTDEITNVTVEVVGAGVERESGNRVQVTGLMDPAGAPVSGATQYVRVSALKRLGKGCPTDKTAAAGAGGAGSAGSSGGSKSGSGKIIGISTTALAVIGGVAAAVVVGGLAATGSLSSGSSGSQVSR